MTDEEKEKDKQTALAALYSEASEFDRHYDRMSWTIGTVITSVMLAILAFVGVSVPPSGSSLLSNISFLKVLAITTITIYSLFLYLIYSIGNIQKDRTRPIIKKMYADSQIKPNGKTWEKSWSINRSWILPFVIMDILLAIYWILFITWITSITQVVSQG